MQYGKTQTWVSSTVEGGRVHSGESGSTCPRGTGDAFTGEVTFGLGIKVCIHRWELMGQPLFHTGEGGLSGGLRAHHV